ncbi:MAG: thioredoxin family protein [Actinomycetota bacterium]|nr:thioredoxin family protein [Actinomycetota bacterium]
MPERQVTTASLSALAFLSASASLSASEAPAPNGTFATPAGTVATIASLRNKPTMVWFVAGGCASCAASIQAVASHLHQLTRARLRVVTLGLYGDFSVRAASS